MDRRTALLLLPALGCMQPIGQRHGPRPDGAVEADAAIADAGAVPTGCRDAPEHGVTADGIVTIDPDGDGGEAPFDVYCDMKTAGGGWTLVWSYGFTDYGNFTSTNNAITPRPDWGMGGGNPTPESTTTPLDPATRGAIPFLLWRTYGNGIAGNGNNNYYYFDGSQQSNWPTHDPCGSNSANQLTGVADAGGAVYVR